ncbi:2'-5' RNA ligase family protein [Nocardioides gilvus]|uniref:2'-5' RNA ligase family protein n=1 Tax=Nocardioides gilvus TaxID=1735589 RepID=UPI000D745E7D|nr:2'-5' RNA ligase family protein [Nocardioides gilvus]
MTAPHPGHSVLQVPVPPLEAWVRARTAHYDVDYLSADPDFTHAHVTALGPFVDRLDEATSAAVAAIAAQVEPFDFHLRRLDTFPSGIIHLLPEPAEGFVRLTNLLVTAFPDHPPYGGDFAPVPHLTLDLRHGDVTESSTRDLLGTVVPVRSRAEWLDLAWYEAGACHLVHRWPLGDPATPAPTVAT